MKWKLVASSDACFSLRMNLSQKISILLAWIIKAVATEQMQGPSITCKIQ